ncbi:MAG: FAD-dependent oxidoreductase [Myxococcota bacterium]|nr:FAD-dependent oxidoreductase [Myxococcota bacterium]
MAEIAIVGSGIAGLACARTLLDRGLSPTLFDKSRGFGGRICTKRTDSGRFDHGAQYITARDPKFESVIDTLRAAKAVTAWDGRFGIYDGGQFQDTELTTTRWVGTPRMSAIGRTLSGGLTCHLSHRIVAMRQTRDGWYLDADGRHNIGPYDMVIVTCPGPQAAALLPAHSALHSVANQLQYFPCWAAMCSYTDPVALDYDGFHLKDSILSWACRDSSKPGRAPGERWVLHADPNWSKNNLELDATDAERVLTGFFRELCNTDPSHVYLHRWRYALSVEIDGQSALFDQKTGLGLCGDALSTPKVEGAWLSGQHMAELILDTL